MSEVTCQLRPAGPPRNWPPTRRATFSRDWPGERSSVAQSPQPALVPPPAAPSPNRDQPEPGQSPGPHPGRDGPACPGARRRRVGNGLQRSATRMRGPLSPEYSSGHLDDRISATCPSGSLLALNSCCWFSPPAPRLLLVPQAPLGLPAAARRYPGFH